MEREPTKTAVRSLRWYWELGRRAKQSFGMVGARRGRQIEKMAKEVGVNEDTLRKARQFADSYTQNDLRNLESQCRKSQRPLGFSFVVKFVTIKNKAFRERLQAQVIAEEWSYARLHRELLKHYGYRKHGGRRPNWPARSVQLMLVDITRMCWAWERWFGWLAGTTVDRRLEAKGEKRQAVKLDDLPPEVQQALIKAMRGIEALRSAVDSKPTPNHRSR